MITEWNIQSRGHICDNCGKGFSDKEHYHTMLFDEKADFRRSDVCEQCWQTQFSQGARDRKGFISYWQGIYEAPPPPSDPLQRESAESLLRKLIELNDPQYIPAAFILAVMLERKRLLKVKEQIKRDGQRIFIYEHGATGDLFTIVDPNLQLNQLEAVQRDVAALIQNGLNPEAATGTTPGSAELQSAVPPVEEIAGAAPGGEGAPVEPVAHP